MKDCRLILLIVMTIVSFASTMFAEDVLMIAPNLIYNNSSGSTSNALSKFQSLGIEENVTISIKGKTRNGVNITYEELENYNGIFMIIGTGGGNSGQSTSDKWFPYLKKYVINGGRLFIMLQPEIVNNNTALMENFNISTAREFVYGTKKNDGQSSIEGSSICSLFKGKIGSVDNMKGGPFMGLFLRCGDVKEKKTITSIESGKERTISCLEQLGKGQVWFVVDYTCKGGGWLSCPYSSIFFDRIIDLYNNEVNAKSIIKWLSNSNTNNTIFCNVHCKVIDAQTKEAISDVTVGLQDNVKQYSAQIGRTNSEGEIELGVSYNDVLVFLRKSGYVTQIVKPKCNENTIKLVRKNNLNISKTKNEFEKMLNQLLEGTEYAALSFKITEAIINGKNFLEISSSALLQQLPSGSTISVAGFFDMKLRLKDNELGWVLDGVLVKEFVNLGIIPKQNTSF